MPRPPVRTLAPIRRAPRLALRPQAADDKGHKFEPYACAAGEWGQISRDLLARVDAKR